jgi:hypothetical protein
VRRRLSWRDHMTPDPFERDLAARLHAELDAISEVPPHWTGGEPSPRVGWLAVWTLVLAGAAVLAIGVVLGSRLASFPSAGSQAGATSSPAASEPNGSGSTEPSVVANRTVLLACGVEDATTQVGPWNNEARGCLLRAYRAQTPAEFIATRPTTEGDPITWIYRVLTAGQAEIFIDSTHDRFAGSAAGWQELECSTLEITTPPAGANGPNPEFGPGAGCVTTQLSNLSASASSSPAASTGVIVRILTNAPGLSASAAEALAQEHMGPGAVMVSAIGGPVEDAFVPLGGRDSLPSSIPASKLVWVVTFSSNFVICPPPYASNGIAVNQPCYSPRPGTTAVMLDYQTGAFIQSDGFSPGP